MRSALNANRLSTEASLVLQDEPTRVKAAVREKTPSRAIKEKVNMDPIPPLIAV